MTTAIKPSRRVSALYSVDNLPESDGKPMGETPKHVMLIIDTLNALQNHFRDDPQMYIIGNVFVYFLDELGTLSRVAPDIFVVRGVPKEERRVFAVEKEGKTPEFVIEFTSKKTKKTDLNKKREMYAWLGVKEYFLFDPFEEYLEPQLIGLRLHRGKYERIAPKHSRLFSKVLNLELTAEGSDLRFYDARTGERLLTHIEAQVVREREAAAREQEAIAREQEAAARRAAEAENLRLREEIERLRKIKP